MHVVAIDTETRLIDKDRGLVVPRLVCMTSCDGGEPRLFGREAAFVEFERLLDDPNVLIVCHNAVYDMAVLSAHSNRLVAKVFAAYAAKRVRCTKIRQRLIDIALGVVGRKAYTLAALVLEHLGEVLEKANTPRLEYHKYEDIPVEAWPADVQEYALKDAVKHRELYFAQQKVVDSEGVFRGGQIATEDFQNFSDWTLRLMGAWGIRTEEAPVLALEEEWSKAYAEGRKLLMDSGLLRQTGSKKKPKLSLNKKALQERVKAAYEALGLPIPKTEKDAIKTSKETLETSGDELLQQIAEHAETDKLFTAFTPVLKRGVRGPICPAWNVLVDTGRTSCRDPNLQQLPRGGNARQCFIPRPGYVFIGADYNAAELRSFAQVCLDLFGQSEYAALFQKDLDPHTAFASDMMGVSYEEVAARLAAGDKEAKKKRQFAKVFNFGKIGGMGAAKFVMHAAKNGIRITLDESKAYDRQWKSRFPEVVLFLNYIARRVGHDVATFEHPRTGFVRGNIGYSDGANFHFQHLTAMGGKHAIQLVDEEAYLDSSSSLYGTRPVVFPHDEIIAEAPIARASEAGERLAAVMTKAMSVYVPDVPNKCSPWIAARWFKEAETVRDGAGRLVEWRPR